MSERDRQAALRALLRPRSRDASPVDVERFRQVCLAHLRAMRDRKRVTR